MLFRVKIIIWHLPHLYLGEFLNFEYLLYLAQLKEQLMISYVFHDYHQLK